MTTKGGSRIAQHGSLHAPKAFNIQNTRQRASSVAPTSAGNSHHRGLREAAVSEQPVPEHIGTFRGVLRKKKKNRLHFTPPQENRLLFLFLSHLQAIKSHVKSSETYLLRISCSSSRRVKILLHKSL